jgi:RsfA family transcription factor
LSLYKERNYILKRTINFIVRGVEYEWSYSLFINGSLLDCRDCHWRYEKGGKQMSLQRVDAWTEQEDKILVQTILDYVRHGKTQLQAFEDAGEKLDRSASACGYQWNINLRKIFNEKLRIVRRERRGQKVDMPKLEKPSELLAVENNKTVSVDSLAIKDYKGQRVITFKDIDQVHGRPDGTASRNFRENRNHFVENKHFFSLKPNELQSDEIRRFGIASPKGGYLITERGYLLLVKSFTDTLSWEVQDKLVETYFRVKEVVNQSVHSYMIIDPVERAKAWIKEQEEKQKLETSKLLLEQQVAEYQPKMSYLDTILESKDSIIVSQISADYGLSAKALNKILHQEEIQYKRNDQWLLYSEHTGQGYTESRTIPFVKPNGETGSSVQTRWTQKGRLFIHTILSNKGIKPLMDR